MAYIPLEAVESSMISKIGYDRNTVPKKAEVVYLRSTANLSTGGTAIDVTDISKDGDTLELTFERSFQGNSIDIVLSLTLDGEMVNATQDIGGGQFSMSGTGKKQ